jgi:AraC-like DNA-binding protein
MKVSETRLMQEPDSSFIVYHETKAFTRWHRHPEYELVLINKGKGKRMIGDHIDRFEDNDLVLVGSYLPHEWLCDEQFFTGDEGFSGEGTVIQFRKDFLGDQFFSIPEHKNLNHMLEDSARGILITGCTREKIITLMQGSFKKDAVDRLFILFSIFNILSKTKDYKLLCSPGFMEPFISGGSEPMQKAMQYIMQNFHNEVNMKEMLEITNMSNTSFCLAFKKTYRMTFKEYLLKTRVGYACRLLGDQSMTISEIAYESGFENLSNFNRQFKRIKGVTPKQYQLQVENA